MPLEHLRWIHPSARSSAIIVTAQLGDHGHVQRHPGRSGLDAGEVRIKRGDSFTCGAAPSYLIVHLLIGLDSGTNISRSCPGIGRRVPVDAIVGAFQFSCHRGTT